MLVLVASCLFGLICGGTQVASCLRESALLFLVPLLTVHEHKTTRAWGEWAIMMQGSMVHASRRAVSFAPRYLLLLYVTWYIPNSSQILYSTLLATSTVVVQQLPDTCTESYVSNAELRHQ